MLDRPISVHMNYLQIIMYIWPISDIDILQTWKQARVPKTKNLLDLSTNKP